MKLQFLLWACLLACSCDDDDSISRDSIFSGCEKARMEVSQISNVEATIIKFKGVKAVRYVPIGDGEAFDSVIYALLCDTDNLPEDGSEILLSGVLVKLDSEEIKLFGPVPVGTEIYMLKNSNLKTID